MTSCILTVIKNEHDYLDEWIRYHLDLGIDHIFIFEDIDSDSHKYITDNYDNVTLEGIDSVLNEHYRNEARILKKTKRYNAQHFYYKSAMNYLKDNFKYDWVFIIDADEFITLEDSTAKLSDILRLYDGYDSFIMRWKCYGANGHIHEPDYRDKGVIDTYTKEMTGVVRDDNKGFVKTCHNLNSYRPEYFYNQHHPSEKANWCNTSYEYQSYSTSYKNIYIRHYITKSWEEYLWKMNSRGYFWGRARKIDQFFSINDDMISLKQFLLTMDKRIMVVLPYVSKMAQGKELELALKLWRKFCQFDYYFIVIGEFDDNLKEQFPWVEFIYCPMKKSVSGQYNPHLDVQHKMEYIMEKYGSEYDGFIRMMDDIYAIKPFDLEDITTIHYHSGSFIGTEKSPTSYWSHDKWKTRKLLDKEGLPCINYATHYPFYFEFSKLSEIWDKYDMRNESYCYEDVYFNYFTHETPILDSNIRLGIWNQEIYKNDFKKALKNTNIKFVCNSVDGWSKSLENSLEIIATGDLKDIEKQIDIDPNFGFEYHLVDSCNLNCAGCSHYSSLFDKLTYPTLEKIIEDLSLIKNKIGDNIRWIRLLGGEPLLHPDLNNCLKEIRNLFPDIDLYIVTNGILLKNMNPEFYEICSRAKIKIMVTYYGLTNLNEIVHDIKMKGVDIDWYSRIRLNSWHYQHIRMTGERIDCLERCRYKNTCNNYKDGKLYLCPHIAYIDDFNRYFGKDIKLDESDYVSIDEINSFSELIDKLNNAKPNFCYQYCNYYDYNHPITGKWKRTEKDINEFCLI